MGNLPRADHRYSRVADLQMLAIPSAADGRAAFRRASEVPLAPVEGLCRALFLTANASAKLRP